MISTFNKGYVVALLFDISGAFDNVWWPMVLKVLKDKEYPKNVNKVIQSYFSNRKVEIKISSKVSSRKATRGCPQG